MINNASAPSQIYIRHTVYPSNTYTTSTATAITDTRTHMYNHRNNTYSLSPCVSFYRQTGGVHAETATAAVYDAASATGVLSPRKRYRPAVPVFRLLRAPQHHDHDWTERVSPLPGGKLERQIGKWCDAMRKTGRGKVLGVVRRLCFSYTVSAYGHRRSMKKKSRLQAYCIGVFEKLRVMI